MHACVACGAAGLACLRSLPCWVCGVCCVAAAPLFFKFSLVAAAACCCVACTSAVVSDSVGTTKLQVVAVHLLPLKCCLNRAMAGGSWPPGAPCGASTHHLCQVSLLAWGVARHGVSQHVTKACRSWTALPQHTAQTKMVVGALRWAFWRSRVARGPCCGPCSAESHLSLILSRSKKKIQLRLLWVLGRKSAGETKPIGPQGGLWVC